MPRHCSGDDGPSCPSQMVMGFPLSGCCAKAGVCGFSHLSDWDATRCRRAQRCGGHGRWVARLPGRAGQRRRRAAVVAPHRQRMPLRMLGPSSVRCIARWPLDWTAWARQPRAAVARAPVAEVRSEMLNLVARLSRTHRTERFVTAWGFRHPLGPWDRLRLPTRPMPSSAPSSTRVSRTLRSAVPDCATLSLAERIRRTMGPHAAPRAARSPHRAWRAASAPVGPP